MRKIVKTVNRKVLEPLSPEELQEAGDALAKAFGAVMAEKENQKQIKSELKAAMDKLNEAHYDAWRKVCMKAKEIEVRVECILDDDGMVREIRTDTGEIIDTRKVEPDEIQGSFD